MPNQTNTPQRQPRRSGRTPKAPGAPSSSHTPSAIPTDPSSHEDSDMAPAQPTQILRRGGPATTQVTKGNPNMGSSAPSTPPRPHSTQPSSMRTDQTGSDTVQGPKQKREGSKLQTGKQKAPPKSQPNGTPSTAARPNTVTPGRRSETPSKAYAGPTFHASPAASTLPLPIFFSKSVPNVDKTTSLKNMMEPDAVDTASESEGSPFVSNGKLESDRQVREESPLDIFFQADRKAKANVGSVALTNGTNGNLSPFHGLRAESSPSRNTPRHHSRHPTDSSTGGIFAMELGGPTPENANHILPHPQESISDRSASATSDGLREEQVKEEQRQAKTEALKRMLFSPKLQHAQASSSDSQLSSANLGSPSPKARQQRDSPTRNQSRPISSPGLASDASRAQRQNALLALAQTQIPSTNASTAQRAPSSNLRKEMSIPNTPGQYNPPEYPGTPTPTVLNNSPPSANTRSRASASSNGILPTQGLQNLTLNPRNAHDVPPSGPSPTTKSIEDDLRRILKLEVVGSDGAAGVRS